MKIIRYTEDKKVEWDRFVDQSKNGTFLLKRGYMDYHADRFQDCSFLFYNDDDELVALLPANRKDDVLYSHQGLTYGGFMMSLKTRAHKPMLWFEALTEELKKESIKKLVYKPVPHIYHRYPAEEDLYALFRMGATLSVRNLATVIDMQHPIAASRMKRARKRARKGRLTVRECDDVNLFWEIIERDRMERHQVHPVHRASELELLKKNFPENIRFFIVCQDETDILAGGVIFHTGQVLHLQYAAATEYGKEIYATDVLYDELIHHIFPEAAYFDFGTSNERQGTFLNVGMTEHKEEFGGRSVVYDTYEIEIK